MNDRPRRALLLAVIPGVLVVAVGGLPGCELLVKLDGSIIDAGPPDGCSICTEIPDGGEDGEVDGGKSDGTVADSGSADASSDATDGGSEGATRDSGAGE